MEERPHSHEGTGAKGCSLPVKAKIKSGAANNSDQADQEDPENDEDSEKRRERR